MSANDQGVSASKSALQTLIDNLQPEVQRSTSVNSDAGNAAGADLLFGAFDEATYLGQQFHQCQVDMWLGTYTLLNALTDLHSSTVDIHKRYSDTDSTLLQVVDKDLQAPTSYLDQQVSQSRVKAV